MVSACVLIRSEKGRFDEVVEKVKQFKEVKASFPVVGRWDVVVDVEAKDYKTLAKTVNRVGKMAGVIFTETLLEAEV
jgi:DNA-binding Lrp family transcriptional regulator